MPNHIPHLKTISDFYRQMKIGQPQGDDFAIMRIEDQPLEKRMEMPLFRCNFYRLVYFKNEGVQWTFPQKDVQSSNQSLYFSYPGKLESWITGQKIFGVLISFTEEFARFDSNLSSFDREFPFFNFESEPLIQFSQEEATELESLQEDMLKEMYEKRQDYKKMLQFLLQQYMIKIKRIYQQKFLSDSPKSNTSKTLFNRFREELDLYFSELAAAKVHAQASVSLIAKRINYHPAYVNTSIKNLTGKTASTFIHEKYLLESKSYLIHTDRQVAEIAYKLGFTNVTYFNRFFKKMTSTTPSIFRHQYS